MLGWNSYVDRIGYCMGNAHLILKTSLFNIVKQEKSCFCLLWWYWVNLNFRKSHTLPVSKQMDNTTSKIKYELIIYCRGISA